MWANRRGLFAPVRAVERVAVETAVVAPLGAAGPPFPCGATALVTGAAALPGGGVVASGTELLGAGTDSAGWEGPAPLAPPPARVPVWVLDAPTEVAGPAWEAGVGA